MKALRIFVVILFVLGFQFSAIAETWKMTSLDWQPYSGSDMTNQGNSIQKLKTLLKTEGIDLLVEFYPWERSQMLAGTKDYVGYFPAWPEEVDTGFTASDPVDSSNIGILVNTDSTLVWKDIDTLVKNYKIGIISTYVYPELIEQAVKKYPANVDYSQTEGELMRKLSGKRFDAAITDPEVMIYTAQIVGVTNIKVLNKSIMSKPLVVAFRNGADNTKRVEILNKILKKK